MKMSAERTCDVCGKSYRRRSQDGQPGSRSKRCSDECRREATRRIDRLRHVARDPEQRRSEAFADHLIWLGAFPAREEGPCQGCRTQPIERSCAWIFHGEIALLHLCRGCTAHVTTGDDRSALALPPIRTERTSP